MVRRWQNKNLIESRIAAEGPPAPHTCDISIIQLDYTSVSHCSEVEKYRGKPIIANRHKAFVVYTEAEIKNWNEAGCAYINVLLL